MFLEDDVSNSVHFEKISTAEEYLKFMTLDVKFQQAHTTGAGTDSIHDGRS
jgi:hypothetical protein